MKNWHVFKAGEEKDLVNYLLETSNVYSGLSSKELIKSVYELREASKLNMPQNWISNKIRFFSLWYELQFDFSL